MKKIIFTMVGMLFIFMICWTAIYFREYTTEDIPYVHLDLQAMFMRFKIAWTSHNIYDLWKEVYNTTTKMGEYSPLVKAFEALNTQYGGLPQFDNDFIKFMVSAIQMIVDPLWGIFYSAILLLNTFKIIVVIFGTIIDVILQCLGFVFNPIFIDTRIPTI